MPRAAAHSRGVPDPRRRGHHRDEDQLHAPGRGPAARASASCCTAPPRWPSAKAASSTRPASCCAHATGTFKYLRALPAPAAAASECARNAIRPRRHHDDDEPADRCWPRARAASPRPTTSGWSRRRCPTLQDGQVLVRHHYLSLDPYMRGRMNDGKSYAAAAAAGRGDDRRHGRARWSQSQQRRASSAGDKVVGMGGWQQYAVVDAQRSRACCARSTPRTMPLSAYLGAVGMPGVTAWVGLMHDHRAQGRRDGGGQRRQRRGGQRRRPAGQGARLPRGGHRRRRRQVRLRGRRTRLRRLHRLQGASATSKSLAAALKEACAATASTATSRTSAA